MAFPQVVAVAASSPADRAGIVAGDELRSLNGVAPRDVIEYQLLCDEAELELEVARGGLVRSVVIEKAAGEPLGVEVSSPLFDRVRTCDNHCEFCFIYQLPKGMRRSLYVKDDDYRLSFLYGNFTTLTRFTEADLERVVAERLSPLFVSIHSSDPELRAEMLRNRRGATSLRFLRALLDEGIEVHGQIVVCPGLNDADALEHTLAGILDVYPELASAAVVPLGVSRHSNEARLRPHTAAEAGSVLDTVGYWQDRFLEGTGRRLVHAADEYYLLAGRPFPDAADYEGFAQLENGVGMAAAFAVAFDSGERHEASVRGGFFQSVDGAPAAGYRGTRAPLDASPPSAPAPVTILTGRYGAEVLAPLVAGANGPDSARDVEVLAVENGFFGGNIAVAGLLVGEDLARALERAPEGRRYLLPDVCLSDGRFLDGGHPGDLPRPVEIVASEGDALRAALGSPTRRARRLAVVSG